MRFEASKGFKEALLLEEIRMGQKNIICGVTGSEVSERAVREATLLAKECRGRLILTYAVDASFLEGMTIELGPEFAEKSLDHMGKHILERMSELARQEGVEPKCIIKKGRLIDVLKEVVKEEKGDLLVLGREEPSFFDRVLFRKQVEDQVRELRSTTGVEVMLVG